MPQDGQGAGGRHGQSNQCSKIWGRAAEKPTAEKPRDSKADTLHIAALQKQIKELKKKMAAGEGGGSSSSKSEPGPDFNGKCK